MANINIPGLTALTAPATDDVIEVYDTSASENKSLALSYVALLGTANTFTAAQVINSPAAGTIGLVVNSAASPTANLAEFRNNGTVTSYIDPNGVVTAQGLNINTATSGAGIDIRSGIYVVAIHITTSYVTVIPAHIFGGAGATPIVVDFMVSTGNDYEGGGLAQDVGIRSVSFTSKAATQTTSVGSTVVTMRWTLVSGSTYKLEAACTGGSGSNVALSGLAIVKGGDV